MKNLKKVLALVLVMAVVFGFTAMTSSAAFTDEAEIARKEAVDVMAAIGVINGYTDGTFKPKGEVTRAEMAKMITVLLNKGDDVGDLYKGAVTFADSASHWAAGYIAYCAQEKIINGRNASTFDPNANVTGTEAAKMLLCAIGYDPTVEGLTGASWASNTLSLAKKCEARIKEAERSENSPKDHNLLADMDSVSMTAPLSREDAAQMILNAMLCTQVDYAGSANTITIGNTSFTTGATLESLKASIYDEYNKLTGGKKLIRGAEAGDDFGRPARVWTHGGEKIGSYSTAPVVSYKDAVQGGKVYTDIGKLSIDYDTNIADPNNNKYSVVAKLDGKDIAFDQKMIKSGDTSDVTPVGSWTEVYVDDDAAIITIVSAKYYIAQIATVNAARVDANNDVTREAYVTLKKIGGGVPDGISGEVELKNGDKVTAAFITDAFTTADRNVTNVAYTKANNLVQSLEKVEVKSGVAGSTTMNAVSGVLSTFALDSASYNIASSYAPTERFSDFGTNATIYLDPNGNILFGEGTASDAVAFVLGVGETTDMYNSVTNGANLLFADGKSLKVNVYNENGKKYEMVGEKKDQMKQLTGNKKDQIIGRGSIVTYSVNTAGEYVLDPLVETDGSVRGYNKSITSVTANNPNLPGGNMFANDTTTFIVESATSDSTGAVNYTYTVYTGLKNVPSVDADNDQGDKLTISAVNTSNALTTASYVFVVGGKVKDTSRASVSVFMKNSAIDSAASDANNNIYYSTKAVVDGEIKSIKLNQATYNTLTVAPYMVAYTNTSTDQDGYVTGLTMNSDMPKYVKAYKGFVRDELTGEDGLYNNGIITMQKLSDADVAAAKYDDNQKKIVADANQSYSVAANIPVYVFDLSANTITQTTIDAFSTTLNYKEALVVMDSAEKLLNNNEIVTAIYVSVQ